MRRVLVAALALTGCLSDLAVGVSVSPVEEDEGGIIGELDAGQVERDASARPELDARPRPDLDAGRDAALDASHDAGPRWRSCHPSNCMAATFVMMVDRCDDAALPVCARPFPNLACQYTCDAVPEDDSLLSTPLESR
jgi:hypothetical protein